jgi:hypothetical protein
MTTTSEALAATPVFFEVLAEAAQCSPADAAEHFANITETVSVQFPVEAFLEEYAGE